MTIVGSVSLSCTPKKRSRSQERKRERRTIRSGCWDIVIMTMIV